MKIIFTSVYKSPVGDLILGEYEGRLAICDWLYRARREQVDHRIKKGLDADYKESYTSLTESVIIQLGQYFKGGRKSFSIPILFVGSDFQKRVWTELLNVKYGTTETYNGLTDRLGDPLAIRAVASANGANALSILVPCHRIIGVNGDLTGYAGGMAAKKKLLKIEGSLPNYGQQELFGD